MLLSIEEAHQMLYHEGFRHIQPDKPFESYNDFLDAVKSLEQDQYITDMHVKEMFIFHTSQKSYWPRHEYVREKKFMLQDKVNDRFSLYNFLELMQFDCFRPLV